MGEQSGQTERKLEAVTLGEVVAAAFDAAEESADRPEQVTQIASLIVARAILLHLQRRRRRTGGHTR